MISMSWTYNAALISTSPLMQVRRLLGDVIASDAQIQDEEINWALSRWNVYGATAEMARSLAFQLARQVDIVTGPELRTTYSQRSKQYHALSREMKRLAMKGAVPYAGAVSIADKINVIGDPDRVPPSFNRQQHDDLLPVGPVGEQTPVPGSPDFVDTNSPTFP
jgi:hypothetical protein